ncbi:MAG: hypothetical protein ABUS49_12345, partial [Acidobacteriota bacterium]
MADDTNRMKFDEIRRDLVRTAIKQPLLTMIRDPEQTAPISVILEANDDYFAGKEKAQEEVRRLVKASASEELVSIGSQQNPYSKASLTARQILDIVDEDDANASAMHQKAMVDKSLAASPGQPAASLPTQIGRYLAIRRVWYNHKISPLIDKSVSTVKADAAHRAFLAEGRNIVWAVIDSGIDAKHVHFADRDNLNVTLPIQHCDFT